MAYTPIGWDENTDVDATKLAQMDNQIDGNESDISNTNIDIGMGELDNYGVSTINLGFVADKVIVGTADEDTGSYVDFFSNTSTVNVVFPDGFGREYYFYIAIKTP